jgi:hypothetical protein
VIKKANGKSDKSSNQRLIFFGGLGGAQNTTVVGNILFLATPIPPTVLIIFSKHSNLMVSFEKDSRYNVLAKIVTRLQRLASYPVGKEPAIATHRN